MALIFLLLPTFALRCGKECLNSCVANATTECVAMCCPDFSIGLAAACSLDCEEGDKEYVCSEKCVKKENSCQRNCQEFCEGRADDCEMVCFGEFCGKNSAETNWVFVIGLIILFCGFVVVLYTQIVNAVTKSAENELLYA